MSNIELKYTFDNFDNISFKLKSKSSGFLLNYENRNVIVTVHHFLPLDLNNIIYEKNDLKVKLNTIIRSSWNELLLLSSTNEINSNHNVFKVNNFRLKIPNINEKVIISDKSVKVKNYHYFPVGLIPGYPRLKYIEIENDNKFDNISGSPVFDSKSKIIGILCKVNKIEDTTYVLPIVYLLKTLLKKDNSNIYYIENNSKINKINRNIVKNNNIFTKTLKSIPLDCYFLIEGDKGKMEKIYENNDNNYSLIKYIDVKDKLLISLESKLVRKKKNIYKVNVALMKYLKILRKKEILKEIISIIESEKYEKTLFINIEIKNKVALFKLLS